jgi:hypothetical protein
MDEERVARLPAGWRHGCISTCPLRSAVVGPLIVRGRAVGSIIAFSEGALEISDQERAVMESLCGLVSNALAAGEVEVHARASASAELAALQAQIEPHFLFNALNTIAAFIRTQPDEARHLITTFAEYCRSTLRQPSQFVSFADEMRHAGTPLHHDGRLIPSEDGRRVIQLGIQTSEFTIKEAAAFIEFLCAWGEARGVEWVERRELEAA